MEEAAPFFFAHFVPKSGTVVSERSRNARRKIVKLLTLVSVEMEEYEAHRLRSIFGKQAKMRELDANLLQQGVRKITYGSKTVKVLLKNNQVLEECDDA